VIVRQWLRHVGSVDQMPEESDRSENGAGKLRSAAVDQLKQRHFGQASFACGPLAYDVRAVPAILVVVECLS